MKKVVWISSCIVSLFIQALGHKSLVLADTTSSSLHAGHVELRSSEERKLFPRLLCQCGDCARLPLSTCACGWAENKRDEIRAELAAGVSVKDIELSYRKMYGKKAIAVPEDRGMDRALWAVPMLGIAITAWVVICRARAWQLRGLQTSAVPRTHEGTNAQTVARAPELDQRLNKALEDMDL